MSPTAVKRRQILIIDGHPLVRRGLTELIDGEPDLAVCAAVATRTEALAAIARLKPELVITELRLVENGDGLDLLTDIHSVYKHLPLLVLSLHDAPRYAQLALQAGASDYVSKREMTDALLVAIRRNLQ